MKPEAHVLRLASASAALLAASWLVGVRVNLTDSIPRGVYRVVRTESGRGAVRRGEVVLVCLPRDVAAFARARGYVPGGGSCADGVMPVGKFVLAVAGDTVLASVAGLVVNGRLAPESAPLTRDRAGRPLPRLPDGPYVVRSGELWLRSRSSRGFDSRYFGAVSAYEVRGQLTRVWVATR